MNNFTKGDFVKVRAKVESGYVRDYDRSIFDGDGKGKPERFLEGTTLYHDPRKEKPEWGKTDNPRGLFRIETKFDGMVIGTTVRKTGFHNSHYYQEEGIEERWLGAVKNHKVVMVVDCETNQYRKPVACLPEDLIKKEE